MIVVVEVKKRKIKGRTFWCLHLETVLPSSALVSRKLKLTFRGDHVFNNESAAKQAAVLLTGVSWAQNSMTSSPNARRTSKQAGRSSTTAPVPILQQSSSAGLVISENGPTVSRTEIERILQLKMWPPSQWGLVRDVRRQLGLEKPNKQTHSKVSKPGSKRNK